MASAIVLRVSLNPLLFVSVRIAFDRNPIQQLKQAKSLFFSYDKNSKGKQMYQGAIAERKHCRCVSSGFLLCHLRSTAFFLAFSRGLLLQPQATYPCCNSKNGGRTQWKNVLTSLGYPLLIRKTITSTEIPQVDFHIPLAKMSHGYSQYHRNLGRKMFN